MSSKKVRMGLGARALWLLCRSVAVMPYWMQYGCVEKVVYFLLRYVARYRRKLIIHQLAGSFPEKSDVEIKAICNDYYHTLAETIVGTMTRHFVYLSSHHNFWEFAQFSGLKFKNHLTLCAYHPLTSKSWDELYYHLRYSKDALPVPSSQLIRYFLKHREEGVDGRKLLLGLIADQNASPKGEVHWYNFLNRPTIFFEGGEQLALKFNLPVLYLSMSRVKAGRYKGEVVLLYDGDESVEKHEITERYVRRLEQDILREPSRWMWSHRRWKYMPDPETGEVKYIKSSY